MRTKTAATVGAGEVVAVLASRRRDRLAEAVATWRTLAGIVAGGGELTFAQVEELDAAGDVLGIDEPGEVFAADVDAVRAVASLEAQLAGFDRDQHTAAVEAARVALQNAEDAVKTCRAKLAGLKTSSDMAGHNRAELMRVQAGNPRLFGGSTHA
jgi:hypothetical protein